jgi:hypothetical protein
MSVCVDNYALSDVRTEIFEQHWFWRLPKEFKEAAGSLSKVQVLNRFDEHKIALIELRIDCYANTPTYVGRFHVSYSELFRVPKRAIEGNFEILASLMNWNEKEDNQEWVPPGDFVWFVRSMDGTIHRQCYAVPEMLDHEHSLWPCEPPRRRRKLAVEKTEKE